MNRKMNKKKKMITGLILTAVCLTACGHSQKENPYSLDSLGDDDAYAFLVMDHTYNVMVSSDQLYDAESEPQAAACCTIYYYGNDSTLELGTIQSDGTAYPLSFSKDGIFAASGHSIEKYNISEKTNELYLANAAYITCDETGTEHYTSITDGIESESDEENYNKLLEEYSNSQIIHFSYGAEGCINELR